MFGSIPAGFGAEREQDADECIPVTIDCIGFKPTRNTFALRVSGDSMIGRHICDGNIVVLEHGPDPRPGQIVAARIDRKSTLKLCPKLIVLPGNFERYEQFSNWMFGYCYDFTPYVEQTSIDEGYFDLSGTRKSPVDIALKTGCDWPKIENHDH